jgi:predicted nuclease with RNAse H fold
MSLIAGIDFGAKMAGTTVLATLDIDTMSLELFRTAKGQDADTFLANTILTSQPTLVCIDAPLSLPGVYRGLRHQNGVLFDDFMFRDADRELGAMSPMFLGGLTARAMRFAHQITSAGMRCVEAYPAALAKQLQLNHQGYKTDKRLIPDFWQTLLEYGMFRAKGSVVALSWHDIDAVLALLTAWRFHSGIADFYGHHDEGVIVV